MKIEKQRDLLSRFQTSNELYRDAFLTYNQNMNNTDPNLWPKIIKKAISARIFAVGLTQRRKATNLILLATQKGAGISDYRRYGIGFYFGGAAISERRALRIIWDYSASLRGLKTDLDVRFSIRKPTIEKTLFALFDKKSSFVRFIVAKKAVLRVKPKSNLNEKSFAVYRSKYRKLIKNKKKGK